MHAYKSYCEASRMYLYIICIHNNIYERIVVASYNNAKCVRRIANQFLSVGRGPLVDNGKRFLKEDKSYLSNVRRVLAIALHVGLDNASNDIPTILRIRDVLKNRKKK